jgi:hypothetical protein
MHDRNLTSCLTASPIICCGPFSMDILGVLSETVLCGADKLDVLRIMGTSHSKENKLFCLKIPLGGL